MQHQQEQAGEASTSSTTPDSNNAAENNTDEINITNLKAAFMASTYYKEALEPKLMAKLQEKAQQSSKFPYAARLALKNAITEINTLVDAKLKASNATKFGYSLSLTINKAITDFIENDLVKRDAIKQQHPLVKWLKRIAGVLAGFFTSPGLLHSKAYRERFSARFFSSPAAYELTLMKQNMASSPIEALRTRINNCLTAKAKALNIVEEAEKEIKKVQAAISQEQNDTTLTPQLKKQYDELQKEITAQLTALDNQRQKLTQPIGSHALGHR